MSVYPSPLLVLSGYVISSGYRHTFARWPGWGTFGRFLWARLSRFYPVHLAVLAVMVAAVVGGRLVGREIPHGGDLGIEWREGDGHVLMTGPVATAFTGELDLDSLPA